MSEKGITLSVPQYEALLKAIPTLNAQLKGKGFDVGASAQAVDEESAGELKPRKRIKSKKAEKANIEATSDEEEV